MTDEEFEKIFVECLNAAFDCGSWGHDDDDKRNWNEIMNVYREKKNAVLIAWIEANAAKR